MARPHFRAARRSPLWAATRQSSSGRMPRISAVRRYASRLRLVGARHLGAENGVPWYGRALGHVQQQGDVAVGERRQHVAAPQAGEAGDRLGPGVEAVPGAVHRIQLGFADAGGVQAVVAEDVLQILPVQHVEAREGAAAGAALFHGGLVALAPGIGEGARVDVRAAVAGEEGRGVAGDTFAPVHDRPEHVEDEGLDLVHHRPSPCAQRLSKSQTSGKPISSFIWAEAVDFRRRQGDWCRRALQRCA